MCVRPPHAPRGSRTSAACTVGGDAAFSVQGGSHGRAHLRSRGCTNAEQGLHGLKKGYTRANVCADASSPGAPGVPLCVCTRVHSWLASTEAMEMKLLEVSGTCSLALWIRGHAGLLPAMGWGPSTGVGWEAQLICSKKQPIVTWLCWQVGLGACGSAVIGQLAIFVYW